MNVFVKSFNRPYYLERCLRSIQAHLPGDYHITVLDDGTHPQYLEKIYGLFPTITIHTSPLYDQKVQMIENHLKNLEQYHCREIPAKFWYHHIKNSSEYFLLLEEDSWLTSAVNAFHIAKEMEELNMVISKLHWSSCERMLGKVVNTVHADIEQIIPDLPTRSEVLLGPFLKNVLKMRSVLIRTGILKPGHLLPYYALYTVTSAIFKKDYWLQLWEDSPDVVKEEAQLLNAVKYYNRNDSRYGKTVSEKIRTSYITSSVNSFPIHDFDMIVLNQELSSAWLRGELNPMQNFPLDFDQEYLRHFLKNKNQLCAYEAWQVWIRKFKDQFESMGLSTQ